MNERLAKIRTDIQEFWSGRTKKQKITYFGLAAAVILIAAFLTFYLSKTEYVTLYSDVSRAEIGRIKEQLDTQGVTNKIAPGGTSILGATRASGLFTCVSCCRRVSKFRND